VVALYNAGRGLPYGPALGEADSAMSRRLTAMVVLVMMLATSPAAFAQPGGSENSCEASNPNIGVPAGPPPEKGDEFHDCGFRNNPHHFPPAHEE
jgi:hypothetical protein